jgi:hypothetical protein
MIEWWKDGPLDEPEPRREFDHDREYSDAEIDSIAELEAQTMISKAPR